MKGRLRYDLELGTELKIERRECPHHQSVSEVINEMANTERKSSKQKTSAIRNFSSESGKKKGGGVEKSKRLLPPIIPKNERSTVNGDIIWVYSFEEKMKREK